MSIGIKSIASFIPVESVDNLEQGKRFGENEDFVRGKIGALHLPRMPAGQDTSDMAVAAIQALLSSTPGLELQNVDALIVVTQNPDGYGLPHTAAIVQNKIGLPTSVAAFDISLGCSGYVHGLYAMKGFLEASGLSNGLLVTADPYSKVVNPDDKVTSLLFGDAATATWIGYEPRWHLQNVAYGTDGAGSEYLKVDANCLYMNGRQVFNFALTKVEPHIRSLLQRQGLSPESVDMYLLHQGSAAIVDAISKRFGENSTRFIKDIEETGNTISSSIPLLLQKYAMQTEALETLLISGFGVGMSWASAILSKNAEM